MFTKNPEGVKEIVNAVFKERKRSYPSALFIGGPVALVQSDLVREFLGLGARLRIGLLVAGADPRPGCSRRSFACFRIEGFERSYASPLFIGGAGGEVPDNGQADLAFLGGVDQQVEPADKDRQLEQG